MSKQRPNYLVSLGSVLWLLVVGAPLYVLVSASVQSRADYGASGPLSLPRHFTLHNYIDDFSTGFGGTSSTR